MNDAIIIYGDSEEYNYRAWLKYRTNETRNNSDGATFSTYSGLAVFIFSKYKMASTNEQVETQAFWFISATSRTCKRSKLLSFLTSLYNSAANSNGGWNKPYMKVTGLKYRQITK